ILRQQIPRIQTDCRLVAGRALTPAGSFRGIQEAINIDLEVTLRAEEDQVTVQAEIVRMLARRQTWLQRMAQDVESLMKVILLGMKGQTRPEKLQHLFPGQPVVLGQCQQLDEIRCLAPPPGAVCNALS